MVWTAPKTWAAETLTSSDLNTHLRDNLNALKDPPADYFTSNEATDPSTTSTSFVDVDASEGKFQLTITVVGTRVLVGFWGTVSTGTNGADTIFDVAIDGSGQSTDGYQRVDCTASGIPYACGFVVALEGITPGSRIFTLQWKVSAGTGRLYTGELAAGANSGFWVQEM